MTDLWLHVNTFFIIVLIFFRYGSHIKKYMAAHFICLRKLAFCGAGAFKFVSLFLKFFLPGTVKAAPAKLCAAFLCTLLNRLRFSPQNVEFGTKEYPLSLAALASSPKGTPLPRRETLRHSLKPSPWGRWLDAKRQDGRGSPLSSGLALSVIANAMPPLPKGEPLAKPHTLQFNRKLSLYAKGSPFGRAVTKGD